MALGRRKPRQEELFIPTAELARGPGHPYYTKLNAVLAHHTGQSMEKIKLDTDRDNFMSSEEAREYGLIDQVLQSRTVV